MAKSSLVRSGSHKTQRHNPLLDDVTSAGPLRTRSNKRKKARDDEGQYVDSRSSRKILRIGQDLVDDEQEKFDGRTPNPVFAFESRLGGECEPDEDSQVEDEEAWGDEDEEMTDGSETDPHDLDLFNKFVPGHQEFLPQSVSQVNEEEQVTNLADLILAKIAAHEAAQAGAVIHGGVPSEKTIELPAKVVEVYSKIGLLLSRYKSGKLPKPFKIIPTMLQWEELLSITRPESWSANACYEATKIFVSSKPLVAQRFLEWVILDRVREDIHETKKLNVHLYKTLKKSLYKPAAFFKGFLFPLINGGTCTLREAHIVSSVLVRVSIPVLHCAAALLRLTEIAAEQTSVSTESAGATNVFIKVLLEKKHALPYKVIDSLVFHFLRFRIITPANGSTPMTKAANLRLKDLRLPVLWHQCFLAFAQRYRNDITEDQREALLDLLLVQGHKDIGPEVRRELLEGRGRGVVVEEANDDGGDDTMMIEPI
ncbi:snoRNA-binding rRNA-processing protein [Pseudocyphellaria aurata]|nr:snoRNA-binding rRNA-processing protein [Pseudocyphellaria aurata]